MASYITFQKGAWTGYLHGMCESALKKKKDLLPCLCKGVTGNIIPTSVQ